MDSILKIHIITRFYKKPQNPFFELNAGRELIKRNIKKDSSITPIMKRSRSQHCEKA